MVSHPLPPNQKFIKKYFQKPIDISEEVWYNNEVESEDRRLQQTHFVLIAV